MARIKDLILQYVRLNSIYQEIISGKEINIKSLKFVLDILKQYEDIQEIESAFINLVYELGKEDQRFNELLTILQKEVKKNILMCKKNNEVLVKICKTTLMEWYVKGIMGDSIDAQAREVKLIRKDLRIAEGSYEPLALWWNVDKHELKEAQENYEKIKLRYDEERDTLGKLYDKRRKVVNEASKNIDRDLSAIITLDDTIISLIKKYIKKETLPTKQQEVEGDVLKVAPKKPTRYFTDEFAQKLYECCNGIEFEEINKGDFIKILNLKSCDAKLKISKGYKTSVYYIINTIRNEVKRDYREEWKIGFLNYFGLDEKNCNSKYLSAIATPKRNTKHRDLKEKMEQIIKKKNSL